MKNSSLLLIVICNLGIVFLGLNSISKSDIMTKQITALNKDLNKTKKNLLNEKQNVEKIKKQYTDIESLKNKVQQELKLKKKEATELAMQLAKEKQKRRDLERKLKLAEKKVSVLKTKINTEKEQKEKLKQRLDKMASRLEQDTENKQALISKLNSTTKERNELKKQLKRMEDAVGHYSLEEVIVSEQKQYAGIILNTNRKYKFCIVSIGKNENITPGIELIVHRGSKLIGKVKIERVFAQMSSARILSESNNEKIKIEDGIRKF